ncbi:MAG: helix-turn-helix domain-containing protein [Clostridiales bacterium]|nr:helix-turn-helix domain-containing protein [Clostridiales bacterium]
MNGRTNTGKRHPMYDVKRTGENLRRIRRMCGYSAEEVRRFVGVGTVQAIYKWERGDCLPGLEAFFSLAELYGVEPGRMLARRGGTGGILEVEKNGSPGRERAIKRYFIEIYGD